jgi:hypothetical protein
LSSWMPTLDNVAMIVRIPSAVVFIYVCVSKFLLVELLRQRIYFCFNYL